MRRWLVCWLSWLVFLCRPVDSDLAPGDLVAVEVADSRGGRIGVCEIRETIPSRFASFGIRDQSEANDLASI